MAQITQRVSVSSTGVQGNGNSFTHQRTDAPISSDGRFVAFWSLASDLVPGDVNLTYDVFVRDRVSGATERVSVDSSGIKGDAESRDPSISADGRFVAFESVASNLVPGDTNGVFDIFVYDRDTNTIERVSVDSAGKQASNTSLFPSISADGRFVAFESISADLVAGDTNGASDVFVHDRLDGSTERVSVDSGGLEGNGDSNAPSISADGLLVAFESAASNLVANDLNGSRDVFLRDRTGETTERVSLDSDESEADGDSGIPALSGDGLFVAFESLATDLVAGDTNAVRDVFVRDLGAGTTERASVDSAEDQGNAESSRPSISADGRSVAFSSDASDLVASDTNGSQDIFLRDRLTGTTERVSVASGGAQANSLSADASISADGRYVLFTSFAHDLVQGDTNNVFDVFLRDRVGGPSFTSLCEPGVGVKSCPCGNPPGGPGRGCDNAAATGGAILSATGGSFLSSDSLVLQATGARPIALSVVMQGNAAIAGGLVFGKGVRCVGGTIIRRLYYKRAVDGVVTVPDFAAGEPTVSARSAAKGDTIEPGQSRFYLVYYRDPIPSGTCPGVYAFNSTQTGEVAWTP